MHRAAETGADAVLARIESADGTLTRTPPARPRRRHRLDPVRDRLAYRSAPLGLLRRATIERLGLRFPTGLSTGEDLPFTTRLWTAGPVCRRPPPVPPPSPRP